MTDAVDVVSANANDCGAGFDDLDPVRWSDRRQIAQLTHHIDRHGVNLVCIKTDRDYKRLRRSNSSF
jgi:hypothetical protein